jgi:hypothetical protein
MDFHLALIDEPTDFNHQPTLRAFDTTPENILIVFTKKSREFPFSALISQDLNQTA